MVAPYVTRIPNEVHNRQALAGYETTPGEAVTPTFRLPGEYQSSMDFTDVSKAEATGGLDRRVTPRRGRPTFAGTYAEDMSFDLFPRLMRVGLVGGDPAVLVSGASGAWQRDQSPVFDRYAVDTWTVENHVEGLGFIDAGVSFDEFTITCDVDDTDGNWKFSGNLFLRSHKPMPGDVEGVATAGTTTTIEMTGAGWDEDEHKGKYVNLGWGSNAGQIREIVSNTATELTVGTPFETAPTAGDRFRIEGRFTSGIAREQTSIIPSYGTKVFLDDEGDIGETQVRKRLVSWNVTVQHNLSQDAFLEDAIDEASKLSPGEREVTGQIRMEFDRRDELEQWKRRQTRALRFEQTGEELDEGVFELARLDLPVIDWQGVTRDERNNNLTATFAFRALLPASDPIITVHSINGRASV